jgi:hypothetical protein
MKQIYILLALLGLSMTGCESGPSLQKYFVENSENKNFIALDVSADILNLDKAKLSPEQDEALKSFDKINILAFKLNNVNKDQFEIEREKVNVILKDKKYQQLMKFGSRKDGASLSYVGSDDHIEEFVLYANKKENGFAVVRILGNDMNPANIGTIIQVLEKANISSEQLKLFQQLVK